MQYPYLNSGESTIFAGLRRADHEVEGQGELSLGTRPSQWRSQNTADARAQRGHTTFARSLVPRPRPALSRLQYGMQKQLGGLEDVPPENFGIFELHRSILRLL